MKSLRYKIYNHVYYPLRNYGDDQIYTKVSNEARCLVIDQGSYLVSNKIWDQIRTFIKEQLHEEFKGIYRD